MTTTMSATTVHVFEKAGLGIAPFRFIGSFKKVYCAGTGCPIQPGGSCDYCGNGIMECCQIQDSNGKVFIVGNVCVYRTGDRGLIDPAKKALLALRREAGHSRDDARIADAREALQDDAVREALRARPHPRGWADATLLGWVLWMLDHAGRRGMVDASRQVEAALKEVGENRGEGLCPLA